MPSNAKKMYRNEWDGGSISLGGKAFKSFKNNNIYYAREGVRYRFVSFASAQGEAIPSWNPLFASAIKGG